MPRYARRRPRLLRGVREPPVVHSLEPRALALRLDRTGRHRIGGQPDGVGARGIPSCPNCHRSLEFVMQLDATDPALGLPDPAPERLLVLACGTCDASLRGPVHYRRSRTGRSLALTASPCAAPSATPIIRVARVAAVELVAFHEHSFDGPFHQLGGEPIWLDEPRRVHCSGCGMPMLFVIALDSDHELGLEFADHGMLYAFTCRACDEVATLIQVAPP